MEGEKSAKGMFDIIDRCKRGLDLAKSSAIVVDQSDLVKAPRSRIAFEFPAGEKDEFPVHSVLWETMCQKYVCH